MSWYFDYISRNKTAAIDNIQKEQHAPEHVKNSILTSLRALANETAAVRVKSNGHLDSTVGGNAAFEIQQINYKE